MKKRILYLLLALFLLGGFACKGPQRITEEQKQEQDSDKEDFKGSSFDEEFDDE